MLSPIETLLFHGQNVAHTILEFSASEEALTIVVAPWYNLERKTVAQFAEVTDPTYREDPEPDDLTSPWDVIGFDSSPVDGERGQFTVNCGDLEYTWTARWSTVAGPSAR